MPKGIAYHLKGYCELIDSTGKSIREDKAGYIDSSHSPIVERLGLAADQWLTLTTEFEKQFCYAAGAKLMMKEFSAIPNISDCEAWARQEPYSSGLYLPTLNPSIR